LDRITLSDVAEAADVHVSTASRALNEASRSVVKPETVERVLAAAERLGYRPHPLARGLRTSRSLSIGVVIPDLENPLFGPVIAGIEQSLAPEGYSVLITAAAHHDEAEAVQNLVDRRVDGLILATARRSDRVVERLAESRTPTVLVNRLVESVEVPSVVGDDHVGIRLAVDHLVERGHTTIGHLAGPPELSTGFARRQAFEMTMHEYGFRLLVEESLGFQMAPGADATGRLLEREPDVTAIVAANDLIGLGVYRTVRALGRKVGVDVAVTGYNDVAMLDLLDPPMTAVKVNFRRMGATAAEILMAQLDQESVKATTLLEPTLSVRASTGGG
jgi:LacI family transcriptional regulator